MEGAFMAGRLLREVKKIGRKKSQEERARDV